MSYLHSNGIIHRDLKPDNILINDRLFPKIADFGLSKVKSNEKNNLKSAMEIKGTPVYISPEIWLKHEYGKASDVYAFAFIVYQLLTGEKPFENCTIFQIQFKILNGYRPEFTKPIHDSYKNLIESCWSEDPEKRPSFDQIVDQLKNDRRFITENIDEDKYRNYIKFISESKISFDQNEFEIFKSFKEKEPLDFSEYENIDSTTPFGDVLILSKENQALIKEAHTDPEKQLFVGKCFIEGSNGFPLKPQLGLEYIKNSYKSGSIESLIYYCNLLIKGRIILKNHEKVKKLINGLSSEQESVNSFLYGKLFENEENFDEAMKYFERSIELGNPEAMYKYGKMIYSGKIQQFGKEKAIDYFLKSIEKGCPKAMLKYGLILIDKDKFNEGIKYVKMAAEKYYPKAVYHYSILLKKQAELEENDSEKCQSLKKESVKKLEESAKLGNMIGMHDYAIQMLDDNQQTNKELPIYFKKCSDKGDFDSMFHYGLLLLQQKKDPNIMREGSKFIKIAADKGHSDSMQKYGEMLLYGNGVSSDKEEASKYYKMAIDKGNTTAMVQYSLTFKDDLQKAYDYMKMAADQGNDSMMELCAKMLSNILGIVITKEEAIRYYNMFNGEGDSEAIDNMVKLLNSKGISITKEQLIDANKMIGNGEAFINQNGAVSMLNAFLGSSVEFSNTTQSNELLNLNQMMEMMYNIMSVNADQSQSAEIYKTMADAGSPESMNKYALIKIECHDKESKKEAMKYFKKAADKGYVSAMFNYAYFSLEGEAIQQNLDDAAIYFKMAADKGETLAMIYYYQLLEKGQGVQMNKKEALKYLKMSVDKGNPKAMVLYSLKLLRGEDVEKNREEAIKYCKIAAEEGDKNAIELYEILLKENEIELIKKQADEGDISSIKKYAEMLRKGEVSQNKEETAKYFKMAADKGDLASLNSYACLLYAGNGIPQNIEEAVKYFKICADKGNPKAMYNYAVVFSNGEGVPKNREEALKYFKMAADNGHEKANENYERMLKEIKDEQIKKQADEGDSSAMNSYAEMLLNDEENSENKEEAAKYFKMSADKGNSSAMNNYAEMLLNGDGIPENKEEAVKYFKLGAENGNAAAMNNYATILFSGNIVTENKEEALKLCKMAVDKGYEKANKNYERMTNEIKKEQIKKQADEGDSSAMNSYAEILFYDYENFLENKKEAAKYFKMSADKGNSSAMNNYAEMLLNGDGIPENKEEAVKYFKLGAENGNSAAMEHYALVLQKGYGIVANKEESIKYYKMAADSGRESAMVTYASMLRDGEIEIDNRYEEALKYFKMAADKGDIDGCYQYALMRYNGDNVEKDINEALQYFRHAASKDHTVSRWYINKILRDLKNDDTDQ